MAHIVSISYTLFFHSMENIFGIFPHYGKIFSTLWKKRAIFSTQWKNCRVLVSGCHFWLLFVSWFCSRKGVLCPPGGGQKLFRRRAGGFLRGSGTSTTDGAGGCCIATRLRPRRLWPAPLSGSTRPTSIPASRCR